MKRPPEKTMQKQSCLRRRRSCTPLEPRRAQTSCATRLYHRSRLRSPHIGAGRSLRTAARARPDEQHSCTMASRLQCNHQSYNPSSTRKQPRSRREPAVRHRTSRAPRRLQGTSREGHSGTSTTKERLQFEHWHLHATGSPSRPHSLWITPVFSRAAVAATS